MALFSSNEDFISPETRDSWTSKAANIERDAQSSSSGCRRREAQDVQDKCCTPYVALSQGNDPMYLFIFTGPVRSNPPSPMYKLRSQSPDLVNGLLDTAQEGVVSGLPLVVAVPKERITLTAEGVGNPRVPVSDALHTKLALGRSASVTGGLDLPKWSCQRSAGPSCTSEPRGSKHPQAAGASGRSTECACGYQSRCTRHQHRGQR